jgi:DNA-binding MarR family transcriptional regulator
LRYFFGDGRALAWPPQFAANVAAELDCSYQLIGTRAKMLSERGLVNREHLQAGRRIYSITDTSREIYMTEMDHDEPDDSGDEAERGGV